MSSNQRPYAFNPQGAAGGASRTARTCGSRAIERSPILSLLALLMLFWGV